MSNAPIRWLTATLTILLLSACASTSALTSNKWRLEVSGGADSDGAITLQFLKVGGIIAEVPVRVVKGTSENNVARRIRDELQLNLPSGQYNVEIDDGEDVLVKKGRNVEDFEVRLLSNTVKGVRLNLQRE